MPKFTKPSTSVLRNLPPIRRDIERTAETPRSPTPQSPPQWKSAERRQPRSRFELALVELDGRAPAAATQPTRAPLPTSGPPLTDRRAYPRHLSGSRVAVCRHPKNTTLTSQDRNWRLHSTDLKGDLLDISLYSVSFSLASSLPVGETVYLRLSNPCSARTLDVPGIVQRCQPLHDSAAGTTQVVCTLRRKLSLPEVQLFGRMVGEQCV